MKQYSSYWRTTIVASIILHIFAYLGFVLALPYLMPEPKHEEIVEMAWVDVDLTEDVEAAEPVETTSEAEVTIPKYEFPPIIMPDIPNEPVYIEETLPPPPEPRPIPERKRLPERQPIVTRDEAEVLNQLEKSPEAEVVVEKPKGKQQMGQPPVAITESYPPPGSGLDYKGYVIIAATIGTDGKVKRTKIMQTSGIMVIDNIAENAAKEWTFKPALDQEGKPMECDKIITFDFKEFA